MLFESQLKMFKFVYDSNHSDDYLRELILRGKQKNKTKTHHNNVHPHFANDRNNDLKF